MAPRLGTNVLPHDARNEENDADENDNTWEFMKENATPLERGRNVKHLERRFGMTAATTDATTNSDEGRSDQERRRIEKETRQFEKLIAPSEKAAEREEDYNNPKDKDPLIHWLSYIKFLQEAYPSDTQHAFLLMERCTRTFVSCEKYRNDVRFVRVCLLYADQTSRPADVFKFLHGRKIGSKVAIFWAAWAFVSEKSENFKFAEKIYRKAIEKEVEPKKFILDRFNHFNRRMSRHWLNSQESENDLDEEEGEERGTLSNLTEAGVRTNLRSRIANPTRGANGTLRSNGLRNTNQRNRNPPSLGNGQSSFSRRVEQMNEKSRNRMGANKGFKIFVDEETSGSDELDDTKQNSALRRTLEREADQKKENMLEAETWNKRGGLGNPFASEIEDRGSSATFGRTLRPIEVKPFDVFVDEECEDNHQELEKQKIFEGEQSKHRNPPLMRERLGDGVADKLSKDPLRYVNNPAKYATDNKFSIREASILHRNHRFGSAPDDNDKSKAAESQSRSKSSRKGYNPTFMTDQDGNEQSQDEARAAASYFTILPETANVNLLLVHDMTETSAMSLATETFYGAPSPQLAVESLRLQKRKESEKKVAFAIHNEGINNQSGISQATNASSVVNEQIATGTVHKTEEETINTKLAAAELSVFFASPSPTRDAEDEREILDNGIFNKGTGGTVPFKILDETELNDDDSVQNSIVATRKSPAKSSPGRERAFGSRLREPTSSAADSLVRQEKSLNRSSFFVYKDETAEMQLPKDLIKPMEEEEKGDTATFSQINELFGEQQGQSLLKATSEQSKSLSSAKGGVLGSRKRRPFGPATTESKRQKDSSPQHSNAIDEEKGDTATFSILNELNSEGLKTTSPEYSSPNTPESVNKDIEMATPRESSSRDVCDFGNLSGIEENEVSFHRTKTPGLNPFTEKKRERESENHANHSLFDYKKIHAESITLAMDEIALRRNVIDCRGQSLPAAFNRKKPTIGAKLVQGKATFVVQHELGRGVFGIVLLCRREEDGGAEEVALKIQSPTECLVHEFRILSLLSERVKDSAKFAFPRALNYFSYGDGSLLSMTSASSSGINLVDLANLHKVKEGASVPEIIALYYTSRMILHLETLHEEAQILHCDVKPDNWVITTSEESSVSDVAANDVLLCDFGKAVDLKGLGVDSNSSCRFTGSPVGKDMEPGSLKDGKSWFFDMDLFGLCASSHVLLFGTHMDITKVQSTKRWKLTKPIRRYWQRSLWQEYFDTLLNDCGEGVSSTQVLKKLRMKFEDYLSPSTRQEELGACLRRQESFLPKRKE